MLWLYLPSKVGQFLLVSERYKLAGLQKLEAIIDVEVDFVY